MQKAVDLIEILSKLIKQDETEKHETTSNHVESGWKLSLLLFLPS